MWNRQRPKPYFDGLPPLTWKPIGMCIWNSIFLEIYWKYKYLSIFYLIRPFIFLNFVFSTIQVSDGVTMAKVLNRIDSNNFDAGLLSKIKSDVPSDNKHLKANNLRKIVGAIVEYNEGFPFVSLTEFPLPVINLAAEGHPEEIGEIFFEISI